MSSAALIRLERHGFISDLLRCTANQLGVIFNREGPSGEISLHLVAAFLFQECQLSFGLDPFGKHRNVQAVSEGDNGANDRHGMMIVFQVADEHAVDLDFFERERVQVGE